MKRIRRFTLRPVERQRRPPTIDSGDRLPLEFALHPLRASALWVVLLAAAVLACVVSFHGASQDPFPSWVYILAEIAIAVAGTALGVECWAQGVAWRIDEIEVRRWGWSLFGSRSWRVSRSDYTDLVTQDATQPAFMGVKPRYQMFLWHSYDRSFDLVLYAGPDEAVYRARLAAYESLLGLPVNRVRPGLHGPDWMESAANYDVWT